METEDPVEVLARAFQALAAELQEGGIGVGEWIEAIKIASYRAARDATDARNGRAIFARMSVRTGMTRSELQRLRRKLYEHGDAGILPRLAGKPRTWRVLEGWQNDAAYCDEAGRPLPLREKGTAPSLQSLIRQYAGDVPASSVLAELHGQGLLASVGGGRFAPRNRPPRLSMRQRQVLKELAVSYQRMPEASVSTRSRSGLVRYVGSM